MRNHLADDVLGEEMVNLMQVNVLKHDIMSDPDTMRGRPLSTYQKHISDD
jgi:hypothetical protein